MAREGILHLSDGSSVALGSAQAHEVEDALRKPSAFITVRDTAGAQNLVNVSHIVRLELRA